MRSRGCYYNENCLHFISISLCTATCFLLLLLLDEENPPTKGGKSALTHYFVLIFSHFLYPNKSAAVNVSMVISYASLECKGFCTFISKIFLKRQIISTLMLCTLQLCKVYYLEGLSYINVQKKNQTEYSEIH